ncbi:hypothetical protein [Nocardia africana]|uniref:Uncharacterized protein n=1 Tax=Nocardia africana TaxID=134964 RepID=A0ABW6NE44_9NOCA
MCFSELGGYLKFLSDEATRYAASAVHLNDGLADLLVEEFLSVPTRAVPPSPGVRAEVVLREAVAAQYRRRVINAVVVVAFALMTVLSFTQVVAWLLSAASWRVSSLIVRCAAVLGAGRGIDRLLATRRARWWATLGLWSAFSTLWLWFPLVVLVGLVTLGPHGSASSWAAMAFAELVVWPVIGIALGSKVHGAWTTALELFSFTRYEPNMPPREAVVRACRGFGRRLGRIAESDHQENSARQVVAYRGNDPFVGAGGRARSWTVAFELQPRDSSAGDDTEPAGFEPRELHHFVATEMAQLRFASHLAPGESLAELSITDWAVIAAGQLPYAARPRRTW